MTPSIVMPCNPKLRIDYLVSPTRKTQNTTVQRKMKPLTTKMNLRSGGWTIAELEYTFRLSADFKDGLLSDAPPGILLRKYLSAKLRCLPMRLSKKFDKTTGILGMHRYDPTASVLAGITPEMRRHRKKELKQLEEAFRKSANELEILDPPISSRRKPRVIKPASKENSALDLLAVVCLA